LKATFPASKAEASKDKLESEPTIKLDIHLFHCGQGDTVLLNLLGEKWVLIDCNLPKGQVRDEFFLLVSSLKINRLDLVCLTHSHEDHYTGMEEVLRYFNAAGRSVGMYCVGAVEPRLIHTWMKRQNRPKSSVLGYERLNKYVDELLKSKPPRIILFSADANSRPVIVVGGSEEVQLHPIAPSPSESRTALQEAFLFGKAKDQLNKLSIVLALLIRSKKSEFSGLLAADTDAAGFRSAMERLKEIEPHRPKPTFDFVKVSHHGSWDSHEGSGVAEHHKPDVEFVAGISAGRIKVLPDREVLRDFLINNWTVLVTTKKLAHRKRYALELFGQNPYTEFQARNLKITWSEDRQLEWFPEEAQISLPEIENYQTVTKGTQT
jgi:beta-lactamase superfamily II metal-dependent hydrolase